MYLDNDNMTDVQHTSSPMSNIVLEVDSIDQQSSENSMLKNYLKADTDPARINERCGFIKYI